MQDLARGRRVGDASAAVFEPTPGNSYNLPERFDCLQGAA